MKCIVCSSLFQDYLENTLSQDIIDELNEHFKFCEKCRICFSTYSLTVKLSRKIEPPSACSNLPSRAAAAPVNAPFSCPNS